MTKDLSALDQPIEWSGPKKKKDPFADKNPGSGPVGEPGTAAEVKERLITLLQSILNGLEADDQDFVRVSPTWPYTQAGIDLLRGSMMCDAIVDKIKCESTVLPKN